MSVYWEHHGAAYVRMAMAGIACYDYLRRLPDEYQLYFEKIDGRRFRFRLSAVLFALIRYVSIAALVTDNYGFFKHNFTPESCRIFFRVPIVLKVVQAMICQFIIGVRTYSIARRSVAVRNFLVVFYLVITGLEWFVAMYARHSVTTWGNCQSGTHLPVLISWLFAVFRVVFDVVAIAISTYYLVIANRASHGGLSALIKGMLYDGIGFLFVVACANTFHVTYYHHSVDGKQPPSLTTSIVFTWIMSQNILLNTRDAANGRGRWSQSNFQPSAGTVTAHVDISFARPSGDSYSTECEHKSDKTRVSPMEP